MKKVFILLAGILALSACTVETPQTLSQKLAVAKTPADRKETLRLACLNEAEWPAWNSPTYRTANPKTKTRLRHRYNAEVSEMKSLCRDMDDLTTETATDKKSKDELSADCARQVETKKQKTAAGSTAHADRIATVCAAMIGKI